MRATFIRLLVATACMAGAAPPYSIPADYLREPEQIPGFWITTVEDVTGFLRERVKRGSVDVVGRSAGKRELRAVLYGKPRQAEGTTTFSGSLGFRNVTAFVGPDHEKRVYMAMAAVHGGEWEPIAGMINLISVLETGKDLRGKSWPGITEAAGKLDRLILIPIVNVDGRARIPLRMLADRGSEFFVQEYFNTGGWPNGKLIGWPQVKEFIPLDFSRTQFPGGYPDNNRVVCVSGAGFFSATHLTACRSCRGVLSCALRLCCGGDREPLPIANTTNLVIADDRAQMLGRRSRYLSSVRFAVVEPVVFTP